jgi:tetratricopeptide (TPR) repeat protein
MTLSARSPVQPARLGLLSRLVRRKADSGRGREATAPPAGADDIERWRGLLSRGGILSPAELRLIGAPEQQVDPELCFVKGALLLRAGRGDDAQRFFRQAPRLAASRRAASAMAMHSASQDVAFKRLIHDADRARDARKWSAASDLYGEALRAYPEHSGYLVQYAHCLKEQEQFREAECHYRSALALGAPRSDVDEHLAFVVAQQEAEPPERDADRQHPAADGEPLDAPPTTADVELLVFLLLGRQASLPETVQLLREHRSVRSIAMEIVEADSFVAANARLLSSRGPARSLGDSRSVRQSASSNENPHRLVLPRGVLIKDVGEKRSC